MADIPTIMLAPSANTSIVCPSSNTYLSNASGLIFNVQPGDVSFLSSQGYVLLTPRNNAAAIDPTPANDFTQGYGIGSLWYNSTSILLWVCSAMGSTPGAATWNTMAGVPPSALVGNATNLTVQPSGTTVSQTLGSLLAFPYTNVKLFNAVGNGVADDTIAINNALAQAFASGTPLYFPPGNYRITSTLTIDLKNNALQGITLIGAGPGRSSIVADAGLQALMVEKSNNGTASFFNLRELTVSGNFNGNLVIIGKNTFADTLQDTNFTNVSIVNNYGAGSATALILNNVASGIFSNLDLSCASGGGTSGPAMQLNAASACVFIACNFHNANIGVAIRQQTSSCFFLACRIFSVTTGIYNNQTVFAGVGYNAFFGGSISWNISTGFAAQSVTSSQLTLDTVFYLSTFGALSGGGPAIDPNNNAGIIVLGWYAPAWFNQPNVPATGVFYTNPFAQEMLVQIQVGAGVSMTAVQVTSENIFNTTGLSYFTVRLQAGQEIALTYTGGTPTWFWQTLA